MSPRWAGLSWAVLLAAAGALAAIALAHWIDALVTGRPVLYGEGAVANAAILLRDGNPYAPRSEFVAANYPPLYLLLASIGDPFHFGRAITIASALAVAAVLWWRTGASPVVRAGLAASWLALVPVGIWGAAVKPDLLAVALTLAGVAALERATDARGAGTRWPDRAGPFALGAGALLAAAVWAKPTALMPAAAVLAYALATARPVAARSFVGAAAVGLVALAHAGTLGIADVWRHVVIWNALPWSGEQALFVLVLGAATLGILVAAAAMAGAFRGIALVYALGALAVAVLGGREGATINYLLDLAAAASFAAATVAPRIGRSVAFPAAIVVQLVLGFVLLAPFGLLPGGLGGTGAWGSAERLEIVRQLPNGMHLVEDSGLLVAADMRPIVDDVFLWSRLVSMGSHGPAVLGLVHAGGFASVISEFDLERYDDAAEKQRARWHPLLVRAVLDRYELDEPTRDRIRTGRSPVLWVYRPR